MATPIDLFDYDLPKELVALAPSPQRDGCRLMVLNSSSGFIEDRIFSDLPNLIDRESFLVVNNTRVRQARLEAIKPTGGKSEFLVTEVLSVNKCRGLAKGRLRPGMELILKGGRLTLIEKDKEGVWLASVEGDIEKISALYGRTPLPPYINRDVTEQDKTDYQTVYSKNIGSAAAPTAGLHFTKELLTRLKNNGVEIIEITLNVGIGTFRPVKTALLENHPIHSERYEISAEASGRINFLKKRGKRLIAVGSTVVRALEASAGSDGFAVPGESRADIFIYPPYHFKIVDDMITNFHLPKSTLLAMTAALAGREFIMGAYKQAVESGYRFFSYGDAMFIKT